MSLHDLALEAGLALTWKDVHGQWHQVGDDTVRAVLGALGLMADTDAEVASSLQTLRSPAALPPLSRSIVPALSGMWTCLSRP